LQSETQINYKKNAPGQPGANFRTNNSNSMNKPKITNILENKKRSLKPSAGYKIDDFINDEDIIDNYIQFEREDTVVKNYRSLYKNEIELYPTDWEIHHIDFNHENNSKENLIAVPKIVHVTIHKCGLCSRDEIERMIAIYKSSTLNEIDLNCNDSKQSIHIS